MADRKYINSDLLFGNTSAVPGDKQISVAVKDQYKTLPLSNTFAPVVNEGDTSKTSLAGKIETPTIEPERPDIQNEIERSVTIPGTVEAKMTPDNVQGRKYVQPEFEPITSTTTTENEPKDLNQVAALAHYPGQSQGNGQSQVAKPSDYEFISTYNIPKAGRSVNGVFTEYTPEELSTNPHLNTASGIEQYFRTRSGINPDPKNPDTLDSNKVARNFLTQVAASITKQNMPAELPPNVDFSLAGTAKYQAEVNKYNQEVQKAKELGIQKAREVAEEASKGNSAFADKIIADQVLKVNVDGKEYRAQSPEVAKNVMELEKMKPLIDDVSKDLSEVAKTGSPGQLQMATAKFARVYGKLMNPTGDVSMGAIEETKMGNTIKTATDAGINPTMAIVAFLSWMKSDSKVPFIDYAKHYLLNVEDSLDPKIAAKRLQTSLQEAQASKDKYYMSGALVGYKGQSKSEGTGNNTKDRPEDVITPEGKQDVFDVKDLPITDKTKLVLDSMIRWNTALKQNEATPEETRLGIVDPNKSETGANEGVAAVQSFLKTNLGAANYKVTGVPNTDDEAALNIYLKKNPGMSAKDVMREALNHKAEIDGQKERVDKGPSKKTVIRPKDTDTVKYTDNGLILTKNPNGLGYHKTGAWK